MRPGLAAFGNALLDYFYFSDKLTLDTFGPGAGDIHHPSQEDIDSLLSCLNGSVAVVGGGSTNCARIFSALGGEASFCGCIGTNARGNLYRNELEATGLHAELMVHEGRTGRYIALVSRDEHVVLVNSGVASDRF